MIYLEVVWQLAWNIPQPLDYAPCMDDAWYPTQNRQAYIYPETYIRKYQGNCGGW